MKVKEPEGWSQDHTRWIQPSDGNVPTVLHFGARLPSPLTTDLEMKNVTSSTPHTHDPPDPHDPAVSATKLRTTMWERAGSSHGTLTQRLTDITSDASIEVCAELGNLETNERSLHHEYAKHLHKNQD